MSCSLFTNKFLVNEDSPVDLLSTLTIAYNSLNHFDTELHNIEIQNGVAHSLIQALAKTLCGKNRNGKMDYRSHVNQSRALRLAVLCSALEMVFRCCSETLRRHLNNGQLKHLIENCLLESFTQLIYIFLVWDEESTVRNVVLSKITRVIYLISSHSDWFPDKILAPIFAMLDEGVTSDIRIDTSCTIAVLSAHSKNMNHPQFLKPFIRVSSILISTLTTANACTLDHPNDDVVNAIFNLASCSQEIRVKMSKRRDTILVILALMARPETRSIAMRIALLMFSCENTLVQLQKIHPTNGTLLLDGLGRTSALDEDETNQRLALFALAAVIVDPRWSDSQIFLVVDALDNVVHASQQETLQIKAAVVLCKKLSLCTRDNKLSEYLAGKVTCLITFPNEVIQFAAISASSKRIDIGHDVDLLFLKNETFQLSIADVIANGSKSNEEASITLLGKCTFNAENRALICQCHVLLEAIVECVVHGNLSGRVSYLKAVELLLVLMADESSIKYFQQFQDLLPWLAAFANATTEDNVLKKKLVKTIICLSTFHLCLF